MIRSLLFCAFSLIALPALASKGTGNETMYQHDGSAIGSEATPFPEDDYGAICSGFRIGTSKGVVVAAYQKQLAKNVAAADVLITANAEILTPSCLAQAETIWRGMRNAYSSTGGQLPLYGVPFERGSPELKGYVAALVDQSERASRDVASMVAHNCRDTFATSFESGEVIGLVDAGWFQSMDALVESRE